MAIDVKQEFSKVALSSGRSPFAPGPLPSGDLEATQALGGASRRRLTARRRTVDAVAQAVEAQSRAASIRAAGKRTEARGRAEEARAQVAQGQAISGLGETLQVTAREVRQVFDDREEKRRQARERNQMATAQVEFLRATDRVFAEARENTAPDGFGLEQTFTAKLDEEKQRLLEGLSDEARLIVEPQLDRTAVLASRGARKEELRLEQRFLVGELDKRVGAYQAQASKFVGQPEQAELLAGAVDDIRDAVDERVLDPAAAERKIASLRSGALSNTVDVLAVNDPVRGLALLEAGALDHLFADEGEKARTQAVLTKALKESRQRGRLVAARGAKANILSVEATGKEIPGATARARANLSGDAFGEYQEDLRFAALTYRDARATDGMTVADQNRYLDALVPTEANLNIARQLTRVAKLRRTIGERATDEKAELRVLASELDPIVTGVLAQTMATGDVPPPGIRARVARFGDKALTEYDAGVLAAIEFAEVRNAAVTLPRGEAMAFVASRTPSMTDDPGAFVEGMRRAAQLQKTIVERNKRLAVDPKGAVDRINAGLGRRMSRQENMAEQTRLGVGTPRYYSKPEAAALGEEFRLVSHDQKSGFLAKLIGDAGDDARDQAMADLTEWGELPAYGVEFIRHVGDPAMVGHLLELAEGHELGLKKLQEGWVKEEKDSLKEAIDDEMAEMQSALSLGGANGFGFASQMKANATVLAYTKANGIRSKGRLDPDVAAQAAVKALYKDHYDIGGAGTYLVPLVLDGKQISPVIVERLAERAFINHRDDIDLGLVISGDDPAQRRRDRETIGGAFLEKLRQGGFWLNTADGTGIQMHTPEGLPVMLESGAELVVRFDEAIRTPLSPSQEEEAKREFLMLQGVGP